MEKIKNVDEYIAAAPEEIRVKLKEFRGLIRKVAPKAEEKISYGMPYYGWHGRLAYFAFFKHHIGLYIPPPVVQDHAKELKEYVTAKAAVQFPHDQKLPVALIKKIIKARMMLNEVKNK